MKKLISIILTLALLCGLLTLPAAAFTDVTDPDTALTASVLQSMGVVEGVGDGAFSPDTLLTRAQFCTLAVRLMGLEDKAAQSAYKLLFTDVKPGQWYTGYVNLAFSEGVVQGYGNGKFGPDDPVTYGQVATILLRLLGYSDSEIGKVWPTDYTAFAHELELDEGLTVEAFGPVTRGAAAGLLYNTLGTAVNGSDAEYYTRRSGVASVQSAIILDTDAENSGVQDQLSACCIGAAGASVEYFSQKHAVPAELVGLAGDILLNSAGKTVGFMPSSDRCEDVKISSAKTSGITDADGVTHRITGSAAVIIGDELYTWNSTGYVQINAQPGKTVRLYYDADGAVKYVYLRTGTAGAGTEALVAETNSAGSELARRLGVTGSYSITKNGSAADAGALAQYDAAYFDGAARTLCVSDYRITGYIEAASPSVDGAETITVAGCTLTVLESAWDTLSDFKLGGRVTLLLTDDGKVAAASSNGKLSADMTGVLSVDGASVTLCGSGLVLTAADVSANAKLRGRLVSVSATGKNELSCAALSTAAGAGELDISDETLGAYSLAPSCAIYEQAGDSFVYSLAGERGVSSADLSEIFWTGSLASSSVSWYRLNSAGQVDILLLKDVTGNCYEYGKLSLYTDQEGINLSTSLTMPAWNNAAALTNSFYPKGSAKFLCVREPSSGQYAGAALAFYNSSYQTAVSTAKLTETEGMAAAAFFRSGGEWYATVGEYELPVSDNVQVYIEATEQWLSGESGLMTALSAGETLNVFCDRTPQTGAQVRVIEAAQD